MDRDMKRDIILDHYEHPTNRVRHDDDSEYEKINSRNVSCIDNIDLYIKMKGDKIEDISFDGEACVISISSTSILSEMLQGKTIDEAIEIIRNYQNMIEEKDYNKDLLDEAMVYEDIAKQPSRKKCATLTWNGLYGELLKLKKEQGK